MRAIIRSVGMYAPLRRLSNDELAKTITTSDEWIYSHTGIKYRHIAAEGEAASDMGVKAATEALERAQMQASDIDLIMVATCTPDYPGFPATACIIQKELGVTTIPALDISVACSGFVYGVEIARAMVNGGGMRNILLIGSEVFSHIVDWTDKNTCVLFGDGAGCAIISATDDDSPSHIEDSVLKARGSGCSHLIREVGGSRFPTPAADSAGERGQYLQMNGSSVYLFAVSAIIETVETLLERNSLSFEEIAYVVPHQANARIVESVCKRTHWDIKRIFMNIEEYANTSAASIPIALTEMCDRGCLKRGDRIITVGFGAGLTYGGNLISW